MKTWNYLVNFYDEKDNLLHAITAKDKAPNDPEEAYDYLVDLIDSETRNTFRIMRIWDNDNAYGTGLAR